MAFARRNNTFFNRPAASYIGESTDTVSVPHILCDTITVSGGMVIGADITTTGRVTGATMTCTTAPVVATDVVRLADITTSDITTTGRITGSAMTCTGVPAVATDVVRLAEITTSDITTTGRITGSAMTCTGVPAVATDVVRLAEITTSDITTTGRVTGATMTCTTAPAVATDVIRLDDVSAILPSSSIAISPIVYLFNDQTSTIDPGIVTNLPLTLVRTGSYVECIHTGQHVIGSPFVVAGDYHVTSVTGPAPYIPVSVVPNGWRPGTNIYIPITVQLNQLGHSVGLINIMVNGELHIGAYNSASNSLNFASVTYITIEPFNVKYYSLAP